MTVYVDDARIPARGSLWSHLTADTMQELHAFAVSIGLRRSWFQGRCRTACAKPGVPCPHWHYDVTQNLRLAAVRAGAREISLREMGELISARRRAQAAGG